MQETPPEMSSAINRLVALFARAETEITKSLMAALTSGAEGTAVIRSRRRVEIQGILAHLLELAVSGNQEDPAGPVWDVVRAAYVTGSERALRGSVIDGEQSFGGIHLDTARALFEALVDSLRNAVEYVGRKVDDEFRKATLEATLQGAIQGTTRRVQSTAIVEDLRSQGVKAFRDRRGREWSLANYAAMSARTTAREAHTRGTITRLAENGLDLVKISEHVQDETDICTPHEGKIYSISGQSEQYPPALGNLPPYHPNCVHVATPFVERFADTPVQEPESVEEGAPAPTPALDAVSGIMELEGVEPLAREIDAALKAIDDAHGVSGVEGIPMRVAPLKDREGSFGYKVRGGQTVPARITINPKAPNPTATAVHEIGHYLDLEAFGPGGAFGSDNAAAGEMAEWLDAVRDSAGYKMLAKKAKTTRNPEVRDYLNYLLTPTELFARSYMQYVARESGDSALKRDVILSASDVQKYPDQWKDEDFEAIAQALGSLIEKKGWSRGR